MSLGSELNIIREAAAGDLSEIVRLHGQASAYLAAVDPRLEPAAGEDERFARALRSMIGCPGFAVLVGEERGVEDVAGFAVAMVADNKPFAVPSIGYVGCLYVDERHRRRGLGDALWLGVRNWLLGQGLTTVQTDSLPSNQAALSFWSHRGFESFLNNLWRDAEPEVERPGLANCEIRQARSSDTGPVLSLWKEMMDIHAAMDERLAVGPAWTQEVTESIEQWCENVEDRLVVADSGGEVIGFAVGSVVETTIGLRPSRYGHVAHLSVRSDWRRRGVGRQLFAWLTYWFRRRGLASIHLYASPLNTTSQRFWRSLGFEDYAERRWCNLA